MPDAHTRQFIPMAREFIALCEDTDLDYPEDVLAIAKERVEAHDASSPDEPATDPDK